MSDQVGSVEIRSEEVQTILDQSGLGRIDSCQIRSNPLKVADSVSVISGPLDPIGSCWIRSAPVTPDQMLSYQIGPGRIRSDPVVSGQIPFY